MHLLKYKNRGFTLILYFTKRHYKFGVERLNFEPTFISVGFFIFIIKTFNIYICCIYKIYTYICSTFKTNEMKIELTQSLKSAKAQLNYTNSCLSFNLENWERKEYEQVKEILIREIESLENRIEFLS